ncbi:MAG: hypothetical protein US69_C0021G0006 [candidate division TM6 bacterium GW2011_GWF2_38_10]|nr:MAG: hypothetical protein US69_C0021G0006 [candidate division TM6 bacterium GW2011_GWF2_38_10]
MKKIGIGVYDFKKIIENNYYYIDKSMLIHELISHSVEVSIIPRPRRFGKTLNMTMLKYFFEKPLDGSSNAHLFDRLAITQYPEIMARQGKSPVIFITFKGIKSPTWDECYKEIKTALAVEFKRHAYILQNPIISDFDKKIIIDIIDKKADMHDYKYALAFLSTLLWSVYQTKPIILIDEYDAPMQAGFEFEYYDEIKNFMYSFFCAGLKDNNNLDFSVITGILRISKDSLFSGMNNTANYSLLNGAYADKFGFLQPEVDTMLEYFQVPIPREEIKRWYNGYRVGRPKVDAQGNEYFTTIYNPWAIIECVSTKALGNFWVNTGGHFLIQKTMRYASATDKQDLIGILEGIPVSKTISDTIVFRDIYHDSSAMWSFLVFTGYLTWSTRTDMLGKTVAHLITPNLEVIDSLKTMVKSWFTGGAVTQLKFNKMLDGIRHGMPKTFLTVFESNVLASMSFFDIGDDGENVYQAFVLGILVSLSDTHEVTTNRESGTGRYDVCIIPHDHTMPGTIIEFKQYDLETEDPLDVLAAYALQQIKSKKYTTVMHARNIKKIIKIGIGFQGKTMAWAFEVEEDGKIVQHDAYYAEPNPTQKKIAQSKKKRIQKKVVTKSK